MSKIIFGKEEQPFSLGHRDASHAPCIFAFCKEVVKPGQWVRFTDRRTLLEVVSDRYESAHGIVDPFLRKDVSPFTPFWVLIDPAFVMNLTHTFEVPFDKVIEEPKEPEETVSSEYSECRSMGCSKNGKTTETKDKTGTI